MTIHPYDPSLASRATVSESTVAEDADRGLSSVEAGNFVAYIAGLHAAERGWTIEEIKDLVALRWLVAGGFIES